MGCHGRKIQTGVIGVKMENTEQTTGVGFGFYLKNLILISIFWLVCSLPIFTFGASCCAAYRTVHKVLYLKKQETWAIFKESFKSNFKKASLCWLVIAIFGVIFWGIARYVLILDLAAGGNTNLIMYGFMFWVMFLFVCCWGLYAFAYNVRFDDKVKVILGNGLYMVIRHFLSTIVMAVILGFFIWLTFRLKVVIVITPALGIFCILRIMEKAFSNYMSDDDYRMVWELDREEENTSEK